MARPRKHAGPSLSSPTLPPALAVLAEALGDAIGRGVARALHDSGLGNGAANVAAPVRRRGRPPKILASGPVSPERRCTVAGCERESRSKGLCSAHYQAERRRQLAAGKKS